MALELGGVAGETVSADSYLTFWDFLGHPLLIPLAGLIVRLLINTVCSNLLAGALPMKEDIPTLRFLNLMLVDWLLASIRNTQIHSQEMWWLQRYMQSARLS